VAAVETASPKTTTTASGRWSCEPAPMPTTRGRSATTVARVVINIGRSRAPVNDDYAVPFAYPGHIHVVTFDIPSLDQMRGEVKAIIRATEAQQ